MLPHDFNHVPHRILGDSTGTARRQRIKKPPNFYELGGLSENPAGYAGFYRWLPGQDSNLRPIGYEFPDISTGLGLSHHPPEESGEGVGRL